MDQKAIKFLKDHHLSAVATVMPDGKPHVVALHYGIVDDPVTLFFCMDARSLTAQNVAGNSNIAAVVGMSEKKPATLELHGEALVIKDPSILARAKTAYFAKRPHAKQHEHDPHTVFLAFTPQWYRFLDSGTNPDFFKRGLQ